MMQIGRFSTSFRKALSTPVRSGSSGPRRDCARQSPQPPPSEPIRLAGSWAEPPLRLVDLDTSRRRGARGPPESDGPRSPDRSHLLAPKSRTQLASRRGLTERSSTLRAQPPTPVQRPRWQARQKAWSSQPGTAFTSRRRAVGSTGSSSFLGIEPGIAPFGEFVAHTRSAPNSWINLENSNYDLGGVVVYPNAAGQSLERAVGGARGIAFNFPREQTFQAWGYPEGSPFDGQRSFICESAYGGDDPSPDPSGPPAMGIGCDMTGGSSGGGWMISGGYVNSVNSFGYDSYPNVMFGPYFGDAAENVYDLVCCDPANRPSPPPGSDPPPAPTAPTTQLPNTFLTWHPARRSFSRRAVFRFRSNIAGSWFRCLYAGGWSRCNSPEIFGGLTPGFYVFKVRAIKDGRQDPTPAVWRFRVLRLR